jgi:heme-degrading monooxygenase HmoA
MAEIVTVFRSRLAEHAYDAGYEQRAAEMLERAQNMPGFVSFKSFVADDGERVSVIHFDSAESQQAWAADVEHRAAQAEGRAAFYSEYRLVVAEVTSDRSWRERASNA